MSFRVYCFKKPKKMNISSYQQRSLPDSFQRVMLTNSRPAYMTIGTSQDYRIVQQRECTTLTEKKLIKQKSKIIKQKQISNILPSIK